MDYLKLQNGSDIRGVAIEGVPGEPRNIGLPEARNIALGFLDLIEKKTGKAADDLKIAVGRDPRLSGEELSGALIQALGSRGAKAFDYGLCSTPAMFMATVFPEIEADGSIMITASHLPFNRNGFKFFTRDGGLEKQDIKEVLISAESHSKEHGSEGDTEASGSASSGSSSCGPKASPALMDLYTSHLRNIIKDGLKGETSDDEKPLSGLKIAVDAGNGAGGFYAEDVLAPLGCDVSASRYLDPDGNFPNHQPNPENEDAMKAVIEATKEGGCDLGLIFDTDVDRSSAVDEHGREMNRNGIIAVAAALIADGHPGTTVVTDSITSNELTDFLEDKLGLKHLRFKRGYRNVINKSIELNSEGVDSMLAIETSGHAAYKDNFFLDDGAFLATRIVIKLALLKREGKGISSLTEDLKEPAEAVEIRMPIVSDDFQKAGDDVLQKLTSEVKEKPSAEAGGKKLSLEIVTPNYEGIRVSVTGDVTGWFLLRKSLHDPIMPLNVESEERGGTDVIRSYLKDTLGQISGLETDKL